MDGEAELEMPSPKRMRLEASMPPISYQTPPAVDDMDDLYGTPPAYPDSATAGKTNFELPKEKAFPPALPQTLHLPGLSPPIDHPATARESPKLDQVEQENKDSKGNLASDEIREEMGDLEKEEDSVSRQKQAMQGIPENSLEKKGDDPAAHGIVPEVLDADNDLYTAGISTLDTGTLTEQKSATQSNTQSEENMLEVKDTSPKNLSLNQDSKDRYLGSQTKASENVALIMDANSCEEAVHNNDASIGADEDNPKSTTGPEMLEVTMGDATPSMPTFEELARDNKTDAEAEFEIDSSPYESSLSTDSSTDTSSSNGDENDSGVDDYEMLSAEEEARRLMAEDGGAEEKVTKDAPRTLNEKPEEVVPKPNVTITADMQLEELGCVENLVENLALIKAKISGEYQVLESGSVLCLEDRSVIGAVAETLGRVQQPYYSVRFTNSAAMTEAGIARDTKIYYVAQFSTTVFTQTLKAIKGSDASNLHDEEVGDDELEFSDDEAEAEHKRQVKLQKRARYDAKHGQEDGFSRGPQQRSGKPGKQLNGRLSTSSEHPSNPVDQSLNYDDAPQDSDDLYTPLSRPSNLLEMMARKDGPNETSANRGSGQRSGRGRGRGDHGDGRGRHRGNRGMGRGGTNDGRGQRSHRGNFNAPERSGPGQASSPGPRDSTFNMPNTGLPPPPPQQSNGFHSHPQLQQPQSQHLPFPAHSSSEPQRNHSYPPQYPPFPGQNHAQQFQQPSSMQDPYLQGLSRQGHFPQQAFPPGPHYPGQQAPIPPSPGVIPPGAHINPNFFRQQAQQSPQTWQQQQQQGQAFFPPQQYQQYQQPYNFQR